MKTYLLKLAAKFMNQAADEFGNHGCNDLPDNIWQECGMTPADEAELVAELRAYNNPDDEWPENISHIGDASLMGFLAQKLEEAAKESSHG